MDPYSKGTFGRGDGSDLRGQGCSGRLNIRVYFTRSECGILKKLADGGERKGKSAFTQSLFDALDTTFFHRDPAVVQNAEAPKFIYFRPGARKTRFVAARAGIEFAPSSSCGPALWPLATTIGLEVTFYDNYRVCRSLEIPESTSLELTANLMTLSDWRLSLASADCNAVSPSLRLPLPVERL